MPKCPDCGAGEGWRGLGRDGYPCQNVEVHHLDPIPDGPMAPQKQRELTSDAKES